MCWSKRKYYLIQLVVDSGSEYWLHKNGRVFNWTNHGEDKEYKNLGSAVSMARKAHKRLRDNAAKVNVVEVTFRPCNPELPDGYYEPVKRDVFGVFN